MGPEIWGSRACGHRRADAGVHLRKGPRHISKSLVSLGLDYPIAVDNDYAIWRAFDNEAWPAFYFIGADGRTSRHVFGEGGYDDSERLIQKLLTEAGGKPVTSPIVAIAGTGPQAAPDENDLRSEETYIGYAQALNFASPGGAVKDAASRYRTLSMLAPDRWSLGGVWTIGSEFATLNEAPGSVSYRFHARDLHLVLAKASPDRPLRFRVKIDGAPPGLDHGVDVDAEGWGSLQEDRMYQLIRQTRPVADRTFEIEFLDPGVRAYVFTFG